MNIEILAPKIPHSVSQGNLSVHPSIDTLTSPSAVSQRKPLLDLIEGSPPTEILRPTEAGLKIDLVS